MKSPLGGRHCARLPPTAYSLLLGCPQLRPNSLGWALIRLRNGIRMVEKERDNFLEHAFPDVHGAVDAVAGLRPINFARSNLPRLRFCAIAELYLQKIAAQDHRHPMKRIAMPRRSLAGREPLPPDQNILSVMQHFLTGHRTC